MLYDRDIREPLFEFLEERYGKARIIEEKQMGRSRADLVMVIPDALVGIEIKSDADTYARLKRQVKDYNQYFDYNYVVAGSTHGMHIREHVPDWWGIITVEEMGSAVDFYELRPPAANPKVNRKKKLSLLWRPELAHIQMEQNLPKYKAKSKEYVIEKMLLKLPGDVLDHAVSEELFERDYTQIEEQIREYKNRYKKSKIF